MAQHDYDIANQSGASARADFNDVLEAITTLNSGATAPTVTFPFMLWADTANDQLKQRNAADSDWIVKATLSQAYGAIALAAIAALTPAADRLAYFTSGSAAALATLTSFGRDLIATADAAAALVALGLGPVTATASSTVLCGGFLGTLIASGTTPTKVIEFFATRDGTYRVDFDLTETPQAGGLAYARVYRNGSAVGTQFSDEGDAAPTGCNEAVSGWQAGDILQVYLYHDAPGGGARVQNLRIYADQFAHMPISDVFTPVT